MWIVTYIFNNKVFYERYANYEVALGRYGVLIIKQKNPSIHYEEKRKNE